MKATELREMTDVELNKQLKDLKEAGLLTQEEYDKKRQEILKGL